jgi:hypothetical protein
VANAITQSRRNSGSGMKSRRIESSLEEPGRERVAARLRRQGLAEISGSILVQLVGSVNRVEAGRVCSV